MDRTILFFLIILYNAKIMANPLDLSATLNHIKVATTIDGSAAIYKGIKEFSVDHIHVDQGVTLVIKNACVLVTETLTGGGTIIIEDSATLNLTGKQQGTITFKNRLLADQYCLQNSSEKTFNSLKEIPKGTPYSLYTTSGMLINKGVIDRYLLSYKDPYQYLIKVVGYKEKQIVFKE